MGKFYTVRSAGRALLGTLAILGFDGPGSPGPRVVDEKRKAKDRRRRKLARMQRRRTA